MLRSVSLLPMVLALLAVAGPIACGPEEPAGELPSQADAESLETATLIVPDMACPLCVRSIENHLSRQGVREVRADLDTKRVVVRYDASRLSADSIRALVTGIGYTVTGVEKAGGNSAAGDSSAPNAP